MIDIKIRICNIPNAIEDMIQDSRINKWTMEEEFLEVSMKKGEVMEGFQEMDKRREEMVKAQEQDKMKGLTVRFKVMKNQSMELRERT